MRVVVWVLGSVTYDVMDAPSSYSVEILFHELMMVLKLRDCFQRLGCLLQVFPV